MSNNHNNESDILDRHIDALREQPIPDGPSPSVIERTMATLRGNRSMTGRQTIFERLVAMTFTQKIAAAVAISFGSIVLYTMFMLFTTMAPSVAFADVVQQITSAHTLKYRTTATLAGKAVMTSETFLEDPNHMRTELPEGMLNIQNGSTLLILDPKSHTARRTELTGRAPDSNTAMNITEMFHNLPQNGGQAIGEKEIAGVTAEGFKVTWPQITLSIWANKKTGQTIEIDSNLTTAQGTVDIVMDHFELNPTLDEAMFSMDAPAGYTLTTETMQLPKVENIETSVADLLHGYADATGGSFPPSLSDWYSFIKVADKDPQGRLTPGKIGTVSGTLFSLPDGYGYAGKDVKFGDKDKIVFWHRLDKNSDKYRAIFGDLHIADVTKDQLPTQQ